VHCRLPAWSKV